MAKKGGKKAGKKSKVKPDEMMEEVSSTISGSIFYNSIKNFQAENELWYNDIF